MELSSLHLFNSWLSAVTYTWTVMDSEEAWENEMGGPATGGSCNGASQKTFLSSITELVAR